MPRLTIPLAERSYDIHVDAGLLGRVDLVTAQLPTPRALVVSNETVAPLYLESLAKPLRNAGVDVLPVILPDGEVHKNWETLNGIHTEMLRARCDRTTTVIALGGGALFSPSACLFGPVSDSLREIFSFFGAARGPWKLRR